MLGGLGVGRMWVIDVPYDFGLSRGKRLAPRGL